MHYEDFTIQISPPLPDGGYPVRILQSPAGEGDGEFRLPFSRDELASLPSLSGFEQAGGRLFEALFTGDVRGLLERSLGRVEDDPQKGLRIRLCFPSEHPDLALLASLPWEILFWRQRREFLGLSRRTPIIRFLPVPRALPPLLKPPLRILVAMARPSDRPFLDFERERRQIEDAVRGIANIAVEYLDGATASSLRHKLLESTFHVLHFMGHGDFAPQTGQGVLLLEDGAGGSAPIPGSVLADLVRDFRDLQMVFLNACSTAQVRSEAGLDPFAGVAAALLMAGVPAVLAMQRPVSDEMAIEFSATFYGRLAAGDPIDTATSEARLALRVRDPQSLAWGTPALFLRAPEGRLFEPEASPGPGSSPEIRRGIIDFSRLLADKTESFTGRQWIFDAIRQFTEDKPRGYFVLRGDPGIGKSALAAQLVKREGVPHHFNVRSEGIQRPETFLRNICSQLIATYRLEQPSLPPEATQDSRFLTSVLERVASRLQAGEKAILVVDALDEADITLTAAGANVLYLPTSLPPGIYIVVTARRVEEIPLLIHCEQRTLYIEQDSAGNMADIEDYVRSRLPLPGIQTYLAAQGLEAQVFLAEMVTKSEGNFMYLRHVLPEIESGAYRDRSFATLPVGLVSYYEDHWKRMRDEESWFQCQLPVLVALTAVREPVSLDLIQDFSAVGRTQITEVIKKWDQFLYSLTATDDDGRPQKRYRLYHASFHDFIAAKDQVEGERVSLAEAHGRIAHALLRDLYGTGPLVVG